MEKLKLLLDVDEVICFSCYLEFVNEFLGTRYTIDDFKTYYIDGEAIPEERMEEFLLKIMIRVFFLNYLLHSKPLIYSLDQAL